MNSLQCYWRDESGVTTVEYALLLGLVAMAAVVAWGALGNALVEKVESANEMIPS